MKDIVQKEHETLRQMAETVAISDIGTEKINAVIADMKAALATQDDGVAIAAPQIAVPLRIFVVSGKAFSAAQNLQKEVPDLVCINPEIVKLSKETSLLEEGCLSVRYLYGKVKRSEKATLKAFDENGKEFKKGASGLLAQIFQHEVDHLNGILFIDKAIDLEEMPPKSKQ